MRKKISKIEAKEKIENFFKEIKDKTPKEIKKIKKLSTSYKIPLNQYKKLFCRKCLTPYKRSEKIRIKKGFKTITCKNCGTIRRIKLKTS